MKNKLLLSLFFTGCFNLNAQSISKQVIGNAGQSITNTTHTLNFTIGEPIIGLVENGESIGQGFWAYEASSIALAVETFVTLIEQMNIFPNPVVNELQIKFKGEETTNFSTELYDVTGKLIYNLKRDNFSSNTTRINLSHLSDGIYFLNVIDKKTNEKEIFKIIKK